MRVTRWINRGRGVDPRAVCQIQSVFERSYGSVRGGEGWGGGGVPVGRDVAAAKGSRGDGGGTRKRRVSIAVAVTERVVRVLLLGGVAEGLQGRAT